MYKYKYRTNSDSRVWVFTKREEIQVKWKSHRGLTWREHCNGLEVMVAYSKWNVPEVFEYVSLYFTMCACLQDTYLKVYRKNK